jgi:hypothetical protein
MWHGPKAKNEKIRLRRIRRQKARYEDMNPRFDIAAQR